MALVRHIGKAASRILTSTVHSSKRTLFPEIERRAELLKLRDVDLPRKDPDFFRVISKSAFAKRFSMELIEIPEVTGKYFAEKESLRRYAIILPLQAGNKDDVIPIPFILDTGAPDFMYFCRTAVKRLDAVNSIKEVTTGRFAYQVIGRLLGPGERFLDHPFASSLPTDYEIYKPYDPRLNLLGIKGMVQLGIRLCIQK